MRTEYWAHLHAQSAPPSTEDCTKCASSVVGAGQGANPATLLRNATHLFLLLPAPLQGPDPIISAARPSSECSARFYGAYNSHHKAPDGPTARGAPLTHTHRTRRRHGVARSECSPGWEADPDSGTDDADVRPGDSFSDWQDSLSARVDRALRRLEPVLGCPC